MHVNRIKPQVMKPQFFFGERLLEIWVLNFENRALKIIIIEKYGTSFW